MASAKKSKPATRRTPSRCRATRSAPLAVHGARRRVGSRASRLAPARRRPRDAHATRGGAAAGGGADADPEPPAAGGEAPSGANPVQRGQHVRVGWARPEELRRNRQLCGELQRKALLVPARARRGDGEVRVLPDGTTTSIKKCSDNDEAVEAATYTGNERHGGAVGAGVIRAPPRARAKVHGRARPFREQRTPEERSACARDGGDRQRRR